MEKTIQMASLQAKQFKTVDGWSCNKTMTMTVKQAVEKH